MLYISELCEDCAVANEIDYAWASIHDNGHVITACDVWLQQRISSNFTSFPPEEGKTLPWPGGLGGVQRSVNYTPYMDFILFMWF